MSSRSESFQAAASHQGRQFAEQCDVVLREHAFELRGSLRIPEIGVEIDRVGISRRGQHVWFEYKGSVRGQRPGLRRTDTLKKAIANGALLPGLVESQPYVVLTSHLPERGSGRAMLEVALRLGYLAAVVCLYDPSSAAQLDRF